MAAAQQEEPELPDWAALPRDLLQRCLLPLRSAEDRRAAIRSCKPFARALLANSLRPKGQTACRLRLHVARPQPFAPICSLLVDLGLAEERTHQQADGEQQQQHEGSNGSACRRTQAGLTLVLTSSYTRRSPDRCLNELAACGVRLTRFTRLELEVRERGSCWTPGGGTDVARATWTPGRVLQPLAVPFAGRGAAGARRACGAAAATPGAVPAPLPVHRRRRRGAGHARERAGAPVALPGAAA